MEIISIDSSDDEEEVLPPKKSMAASRVAASKRNYERLGGGGGGLTMSLGLGGGETSRNFVTQTSQSSTATSAAAPAADNDDDSSVSSADSIWDKAGLPPKKNKAAVAKNKKAVAAATRNKKCDALMGDDSDEELEVVVGDLSNGQRNNNGLLKNDSTVARGSKQDMSYASNQSNDQTQHTIPAPTVDAWIGDWKIVLLIDHREFGQNTGYKGNRLSGSKPPEATKTRGFLNTVEKTINKHFGGEHCEHLHLYSADYMFVARLMCKTTGQVIDERVLDLIIERKDVNDLCQCIILDSKKYAPLSFFEAQMYKFQKNGISRKVFLMEGDEDNVNTFNIRAAGGSASEMEQMKRLKRVKTTRLHLERGDYKGVDIVCTRDKHDTVQWLIHQFAQLQKSFDPLHPPDMTMEDHKNCIDREMKAPTFQEYLRLLSIKGNGPVKVMKVIKDLDLDWDKSFMCPSSYFKKTKATLEDRATFWNESDSDLADRNLKNAKARRTKTKRNGGVFNASVTSNGVDLCQLCNKEVDIFDESEAVATCNQVAKCGQVFHESCLSAQNFDIGLSDGCIICKGQHNFAINSNGNDGKKTSSALAKKAKKSPPKSNNSSHPVKSSKKVPPKKSSATKAKGKKPSSSSKKQTTGANKRPYDGEPPTPEQLYIKRRKINENNAFASANINTTVIDRNGLPSNPVRQSMAAALLLADDLGAISKKTASRGNKAAKKRVSAVDEDEDTTSCHICKKSINVWVEGADILLCNRVNACGSTFHEACLKAKGYDLQAHDGCIKCEPRSKFYQKKASGMKFNTGSVSSAKKPAAMHSRDVIALLDSDEEHSHNDDEGIIVID